MCVIPYPGLRPAPIIADTSDFVNLRQKPSQMGGLLPYANPLLGKTYTDVDAMMEDSQKPKASPRGEAVTEGD